MRATSAATCSGSRWSVGTAMPVPPAAVTRSAVSSIVSGRSYSDRRSRVVRPVTYTVAPASPRPTAMPAAGAARRTRDERDRHLTVSLPSMPPARWPGRVQ